MGYTAYCEYGEQEELNLDDLFYAVKENTLIEIQLDNDNGYYIRQWKDIPITYTNPDSWETFDMKYWMLYCTNWNVIESVWKWWGADDLKEWIETCENYI